MKVDLGIASNSLLVALSPTFSSPLSKCLLRELGIEAGEGSGNADGIGWK